MSELIRQLKISLETLKLTGQGILLAVSGGADSVALLRSMHALRGSSNLTLHVAHFNHNLRGDASRQDAEWLDALCRQLEVPITIESENVRDKAESQGKGIEETARDLRYAFLTRIAQEACCSHIAVAHTADDQVETILHHLIRGSGLPGLSGIPVSRFLTEEILLVRPLLKASRNDVETYLQELGQDYREDLTNQDESYTRNRIRHKLLPLLREEYNPRVNDALLRLAEQAGDVQQTLEAVARQLLDRSIEDRSETVCRINCTVLSDQPLHLIRECFRLLWKQQKWSRQRMGFAEWNRLAELVVNEGTVTFPGNLEARRRGDLLVLRKE